MLNRADFRRDASPRDLLVTRSDPPMLGLPKQDFMKHEAIAALSLARLYGILDLGYCTVEDAANRTKQLLEGGVQVLQLRAKDHSPEVILALARTLQPLCREAGVPFVVNDHPEIAREVGADGVHVGQDDLSVAEARRLAGPDCFVGKSTHSLDQAVAAVAESPDYIGFGPLLATPTKPDYRPIGLGEIATVEAVVPFPVFCIGGIKKDNLPLILAAGAHRVVIVSGILQAEDPAAYARSCRELLGTADGAV
jgi:thiamine-phosphate pyrophosphorylase